MGKAKAPKQSAQAGGVALPPTDEQALAPLQTPPARGAAPCDELFTDAGLRAELVSLYRRALDGADHAETSRDQASFMGIATRILKDGIGGLVAGDSQKDALREAVAAAKQLEKLLSGGKSGRVVRRDNAPPFDVPDPPATH